MLYFYSPAEYNWVALSINIEGTKIILSTLLEVIYMTNQNTHGMRHLFSNLQSRFSLILPYIRDVTLQLHILLQLYAYVIIQLHIIHQRPRYQK